MVITFPRITITWGLCTQHYDNLSVPVIKDGDWLIVEPKDWAPGVWAGTEGCRVLLDNDYAYISIIDLNQHRVKVIKY